MSLKTQTSSSSQTTHNIAHISSPVLSRHSVIASCRTSNSGSHITDASAAFVHQCLCAPCNGGFLGGGFVFQFFLAVKSTPVFSLFALVLEPSPGSAVSRCKRAGDPPQWTWAHPLLSLSKMIRGGKYLAVFSLPVSCPVVAEMFSVTHLTY